MYIVLLNYYLLIDVDYSIVLSLDVLLNYFRFLIDMVFIFVLEVYEQYLVGCIFIGVNFDGVDGCVVIKRNGGIVFVQDLVEVSVDIMLLFVIKVVRVDGVLFIYEIVGCLVKMGVWSNVL